MYVVVLREPAAKLAEVTVAAVIGPLLVAHPLRVLGFRSRMLVATVLGVAAMLLLAAVCHSDATRQEGPTRFAERSRASQRSTVRFPTYTVGTSMSRGRDVLLKAHGLPCDTPHNPLADLVPPLYRKRTKTLSITPM